MDDSLRSGDIGCQHGGDYRSSARLRWAMAHEDEDRKALGKRLAAARTLAGLTIAGAADALRKKGYPITKQGLGHWETGRNVPDAIWLRRLAKLYGSTLDALVWDDAITMEAMQVASEFDSLSAAQKRTFRAVWTAYVSSAISDEKVAEHLPAAPLDESLEPDIGDSQTE